MSRTANQKVTVTFADLHVVDGEVLVNTGQQVAWARDVPLMMNMDNGVDRGVFVTDQWRGFSAAAARATEIMLTRAVTASHAALVAEGKIRKNR